MEMPEFIAIVIVLLYYYAATGDAPLNERDIQDIYQTLQPKAARWRDIGGALGFLQGELDGIQNDPMLMMQGAPGSWLMRMLSIWQQWAPGDGRGSTCYATRSSLRAALLKANLGQLANKFQ